MIQAELKGKLPEVENREDVLTSNVLGLMKYLPPRKGIFKILSELKDYSMDRNSLFDNLKSQNININDYDTVDYLFWENSPKHGEPDLILIIKSPKQHLKELMLCIEVKYFSGKSRSGEYDQLMDYCLSLENKDARKTYKNPKIKKFNGIFLGLIYLTYFSQYNSVREALREIRKKGFNDYESNFYELRWNDVTRVLSSSESKNKYENKLIKDVVLLLKKKNLVDFEGFTNVSFSYKFDKHVFLEALK